MMNTINVFLIAIILGISMAGYASFSHSNLSLIHQRKLIKKIEKANPDLDPKALLAGIRAYDHLRGQHNTLKPLLTVINFNKPSNKKRLWVIDLHTGKVEFNTYVAHGKNTGGKVAQYFSNVPGSYQSSIGVYLTGKSYDGTDGYSLRLHGLDSGFNSNVFKRDIVMHPAWYVSQAFVNKYGYVGRTHGCFGISRKISKPLINTIKDGTVMVAYYPNQRWLDTSMYERPLEYFYFNE